MLGGHYRKTSDVSTNANQMPERDPNSLLRTLIAAATTVAVGLGLAGCSQPKPPADPQLAALIQRIGQAEIRRSPEEADMLGLSHDIFGGPYESLLDDRSMAANQRVRTTRLDVLAELEAIDRTALTRDSLRLLDSTAFVYQATAAMDRHGYGYATLGWAGPYVINPFDGAYTDLLKFLTTHHAIKSRDDANAWLVRLARMDDEMRAERRRFETDMAAGAAPSRAIMQRTLDKVRSLTPHNPRDHQLVQFFTESVAQIPAIPEDEIKKLVDRAVTLVGGDIAAEYRALAKTLETALPKARDEPGVWRLADGESYYADALKLYTTTDTSPADLHKAGEKLVADISKRIDALLLEFGQEEGTVGQRMRVLSIEPTNLFPDTPEGQAALISAIESHIQWIEPRLSRIIESGPRGKLEIRNAPQSARDTAPGGYYKAAALDGSRPATYNLNLRSTLDWPVWSLATLSFHEAAPGHHIQAGRAREKANQPVLNYLIASPAFSEGWGVYAEDLADELGAYEADKLGKLGYLQSLLFRAARLVVDTGIHSQRWSREQAIDYLTTTTGLPRDRMENEVDRYTVWPGQACSYMTGRETLRRLRDDARQELGAAFDIRTFHEQVLAPGPRPLPVVENDVYQWLGAGRPQPPQNNATPS
jgi:uncharacterized protein (DUF885 family)